MNNQSTSTVILKKMSCIKKLFHLIQIYILVMVVAPLSNQNQYSSFLSSKPDVSSSLNGWSLILNFVRETVH